MDTVQWPSYEGQQRVFIELRMANEDKACKTRSKKGPAGTTLEYNMTLQLRTSSAKVLRIADVLEVCSV